VQPETQYGRLGRDRIAYQMIGEGPLVLVNAPGSFSHADVVFEDPAAVLYYRRLASFCKVVHFDRRGDGRLRRGAVGRPAAAGAVHRGADAVGVERAAILAMFDVGPMAILFAATTPQRTAALILANTSAKHLAADDYPIGIPPEVAETLRASMEEYWGLKNWHGCWCQAAPTTTASAAGTPSCSAPSPARRPSRPSCMPPTRWTPARCSHRSR
jgi:pimeloyl-ACP methyl ester carboxylesterase